MIHKTSFVVVLWNCYVCFFFQAEDGIRDFCLSRGLGDVYKRQDGVLAARLSIAGPNFVTPEARRAFFETLRDRVAELPGMGSVALASSSVPTMPFNSSTTFAVEGRQETVLAYNERVTPQYFDTIGIPLQRGRVFTADDRFGRTPVMVINETMARTLFPNED